MSWQVAEASLAAVFKCCDTGAATCQEPFWIDVHVTNSISASSTPPQFSQQGPVCIHTTWRSDAIAYTVSPGEDSPRILPP